MHGVVNLLYNAIYSTLHKKSWSGHHLFKYVSWSSCFTEKNGMDLKIILFFIITWFVSSFFEAFVFKRDFHLATIIMTNWLDSRISRSAYYNSGLFWHGIMRHGFYPNVILDQYNKKLEDVILQLLLWWFGMYAWILLLNCRIIMDMEDAGRILVYQCRIILAGFLVVLYHIPTFCHLYCQNMIYKIPIK